MKLKTCANQPDEEAFTMEEASVDSSDDETGI